MLIKNFDIVSFGKDQLQQLFSWFTKDFNFMANTNQLNINNAEDCALEFMDNFKEFLTLMIGNFLGSVAKK